MLPRLLHPIRASLEISRDSASSALGLEGYSLGLFPGGVDSGRGTTLRTGLGTPPGPLEVLKQLSKAQ